MKKRLLPFLSVLIAIILVFGTILALAADENPLVQAGQTHKGDLITAGYSVTNDGTIQGDLIAGAQTITAKGSVDGDIIAGASNSIDITGNVGGNVRVGGNSVSLSSTVERNVMMLGNLVEVSQNAVIKGNAYFFGSSLKVSGNVKGNTSVYGADVTLGGNYEGDVVINDMTEGTKLEMLQGTVIKGKLTYKGVTEYQVPSYVQVGSYEFVKISPATNVAAKPAIEPWKLVRKILTLVVYYLFALLLYKLFPRFFVRSGDFIGAKPVTAAGIGIATLGSLVGGLLLLILLLVLSIFLFEASVFIFAGFAFTFIATITMLFADIPVSLWLGNSILKRNTSVPARLACGLGVITAVKVVLDLLGGIGGLSTLTGVISFLVSAAIWVLGTGAILRIFYEIFKSANKQAQAEETPNQTLDLI